MIKPNRDGSSVTVTSKSPDFIFSELCNYEVLWPAGLKENDKLVLSATTLAEGVSVYIAKSKDGLETGVKAEEIKLIKDGRYEVAHP